MVETIEYSVVLAASLLLTGFGAYLYNNYAGYVNSANSFATYSTILSFAQSSSQGGLPERTALFLDNVTLACKNGLLHFASGTLKIVHSLDVGCNFVFARMNGLRTLTFREVSGNLTLEVK